MGRRVTLIFDDDEIDHILVKLAGSQRKRGQYVSELIRTAWTARQAQDQPIDLQSLALCLKVVERRLGQVENEVAALIVRSS